MEAGRPTPDPALRALDQFVGTWTMSGRTLDSEADNISGRATYRWLEGGFFLAQDIELDFAGMFEVRSHELIGHDPESGAFSSLVYSNLSPVPLPYSWEVDGRELRIVVSYGPLDATFTGSFDESGDAFSGAWRANPGADESVNVPYDIAGTRVE
jgi:uncharacterized protein DUF1579